jgi:cardiolipin synthase A/B
MQALNHLVEYWSQILAVAAFLTSLLASAHALLHKRDSRAAVSWLCCIWLLPLVGAFLYLMLGINRIRRRALSLGRQHARNIADGRAKRRMEGTHGVWPEPEAPHLKTLSRLVGHLVGRPLASGNRVEVLVNGDAAFPAMLTAIETAASSVALSTYIFDNDRSGRSFADALGRAVARGVAVRVLIDDAGARYSWPSIVGLLQRARVPLARFLPSLKPWRLMTVNLRNHRKILVVDGRVGFTGGMNIRAANLVGEKPRRPVQDLHFRLEGPVVAQLQEAFVADWAFSTDEILTGETWFPSLEEQGAIVARGITDGPDADFEKLRWTILGALACAQHSVQILTPYFLPDPALISALNLAAMRGLQVDIILPSQNNLPFVHWATRAMLWQVLERGCRVWFTPPPFDHSKLMLVDGHWTLFGSANWDPRSLRLNFEFNVECYGHELASTLETLVRHKLQQSERVTLAQMDDRSLPGKLRDGIARLFTPYL